MVKDEGPQRTLPRLTAVVENLLWYSRLVVIVPVIGSIAMGFAAVYLATVEVLAVFTQLGGVVEAAGNLANFDKVANELLAAIIKAADVYLLAAILLIFGLGLYELFIDRIDPAEQSTVAPRLLLIRSLDDLKERLAKVVLLILVIEFLQYALRVPLTSALDLLYLAIGILFIGAAVYLSSRASPEHHANEDDVRPGAST